MPGFAEIVLNLYLLWKWQLLICAKYVYVYKIVCVSGGMCGVCVVHALSETWEEPCLSSSSLSILLSWERLSLSWKHTVSVRLARGGFRTCFSVPLPQRLVVTDIYIHVWLLHGCRWFKLRFSLWTASALVHWACTQCITVYMFVYEAQHKRPRSWGKHLATTYHKHLPSLYL